MDERRRRTLVLIETACVGMALEARGKALVYVARDFAEEDEGVEVRRVLRTIDESYFTDHMHRHTASDKLFAEAVARLIELFGYEFWLLAREPAGTS